MPRILLVDDDPDILDIIRLELEDDKNNKVSTCRDAREVLKKTDPTTYDVIISDLHMPGLDGADLVRELRARNYQSRIIIYSGHDMGDGIRRALDSGADYYLARQGDPDKEFTQLRSMINKANGKK